MVTVILVRVQLIFRYSFGKLQQLGSKIKLQDDCYYVDIMINVTYSYDTNYSLTLQECVSVDIHSQFVTL